MALERNSDPLTAHLERTRLCRHFLVGKCEWGLSCRFAHGESELRAVPDKLLLKASWCPFSKNGLRCKNWQRCRHSHSQEELDASLGQLFRERPDLYHRRTELVRDLKKRRLLNKLRKADDPDGDGDPNGEGDEEEDGYSPNPATDHTTISANTDRGTPGFRMKQHDYPDYGSRQAYRNARGPPPPSHHDPYSYSNPRANTFHQGHGPSVGMQTPYYPVPPFNATNMGMGGGGYNQGGLRGGGGMDMGGNRGMRGGPGVMGFQSSHGEGGRRFQGPPRGVGMDGRGGDNGGGYGRGGQMQRPPPLPPQAQLPSHDYDGMEMNNALVPGLQIHALRDGSYNPLGDDTRGGADWRMQLVGPPAVAPTHVDLNGDSHGGGLRNWMGNLFPPGQGGGPVGPAAAAGMGGGRGHRPLPQQE
uniref:C3H1-type domain-containing protein n=1 Tax=Chromera velia CCMP2878 TaxID=1169474 RepID=A0A0G4F928_9ALVE|eukprot:Cvel_15842.t1-p1 / transcript=Cvel_15842.t1 / gene=Cvel_15842 / organism=Chromera_velia_CCMP2878 / gene_product=hypothetical protein / transcript_product=hypothetical protein / location=Cvel_scaffold1192:26901-29015(+) / protein_length=415 / sequence_SO=supercontig / SO=protein_coding / is_pseudo=false